MSEMRDGAGCQKVSIIVRDLCFLSFNGGARAIVCCCLHGRDPLREPINLPLYGQAKPSHARQGDRINSMNSSSEDKIQGTAKEVVGKVKEETGKAIGNPDLEDRGTAEKVEGKVENKIGDVKKVFGQ